MKTIVTLVLHLGCLILCSASGQTTGNGPHPLVARTPDASAAEDWTQLSLAGRPLKIIGATRGERDEYPTFTREMIQLAWRPDDPIYLFLILPKGHPKPPIILYLYSYPAETKRFLNDDFCAMLAKDGFAAAGFVSALTGHRYHDRPMKEWFVSELQEALGKSVHDVQMVLNFLETRNDLDLTRVGMFGDGSGAAIGILTAAVDPRIKALDLADPWGDWPDWLAKSTLIPENERPAYLEPEFLKRVAGMDPVAWFGKVQAAVRLQYVRGPGITPLAARERVLAAAPPQCKIVPHDEAAVQYKASRLNFLDWIKDQLQPTQKK
ncbi:MAG: alpha/beta hydrolase [Bryobacteraceae bacterium]|jgi:hypothetical protein